VKKEVDPSTGDVFPDGDDEEYPLDEIEVGFSDYAKPNPLPDFRAAWDAMTPDHDLTQVFRLDKHKSIADAVAGPRLARAQRESSARADCEASESSARVDYGVR